MRHLKSTQYKKTEYNTTLANKPCNYREYMYKWLTNELRKKKKEIKQDT